MANTTIQDAVMEIVSVDLDGGSFQTQILSCLQMLRENETERAKFSDSICFEAVSACSSVGGQERVQFILLNALTIEYQTMVAEGQDLKQPSNQMKNLSKSLCILNLNSSLLSGSDEMNLRAFTFFRNPIENDHPLGRTILRSLLSLPHLPHTNESYGLYISALLLAMGVYQMVPPVNNELAQKWISDYEDEQTAFRRDVIDLFGRRVFALGGSAKPATAVHINLSRSIIATLTEEEFNKSIVGPIKFKLMNAPHDLMETIAAFINSLIQTGKGTFIQPHLKAGTNLIGSCTKQVITSENSKVRDDASFALSTMITACPEQATNDIVVALITPFTTEQNPNTEPILMCLERLGNTISTIKNNNNNNNNRFWEVPSNNVITALQNLTTTDKRSALECWLTLAGREDEINHSAESSSSSILLDFGNIPESKPAVSSLDRDLQAKRNAAASSFTSTKPGAHNVNSVDLDRKIAAKSNARSNVSNYESQLAAKTRANARLGHKSGECSNISDLDDRINRKSMLPQSDDKKESSFSQVPAQQNNMPPTMEVKQTTADHLCSPDDVERNIFDDEEEKKSSSSRDNDDLAVAVAVDPENEENPFLPAALEYDPDAKPKLYQSKRFRCAAVISILVLIGMSVGIAVGVSRNVSETMKEDPIKEDLYVTATPTRTPTTSPTTYLKKLSKEKLIEISHMVSPDIQYNSSIHNKVLNWMERDQIVSDIYYNSEGSIYEIPRFIERYTLACIYFSVSGDPPTMSNCRQFDEYVQKDSNLTHCNFTDRNGDTSVRARWMSPLDICDWGGISCSDLHLQKTADSVHELDLDGMGLIGFIPPEIGLLTDLRSVYLSDNLIKGKIPRQIGELKQLEIFEGQSNELSGSLPMELFALTNLRQLNLAGNKLQGQLDPEINKLSHLIGLHLFSNKFSGPIPSEIGQLGSLQEITLSQNSFNSTIPSELGTLQQLTGLHLSNNPSLSGSIPSEIGNLRKLRMLILDGCSLTNSIPDTIYNLTRLEYFMVSKNKLSGPISPKISKLKSLQLLWLKENSFNGIIPSEIGSLMKLERVGVYRNEFRGNVANEICNLFSKGKLQELSADCKATKKGDAEVSCMCCTTCCEPGDKGVCHNKEIP